MAIVRSQASRVVDSAGQTPPTPCVVDKNVDAAEALGDVSHRRFHRGFIADVAGPGRGAFAKRPGDRGDGRVSIEERQAHAAFVENVRDRLPDSVRTPVMIATLPEKSKAFWKFNSSACVLSI
jgi:hypothetical protein